MLLLHRCRPSAVSMLTRRSCSPDRRGLGKALLEKSTKGELLRNTPPSTIVRVNLLMWHVNMYTIALVTDHATALGRTNECVIGLCWSADQGM